MIDERILEILACPKCENEVVYIKDGFICSNCKLLFRVEDSIPNFLIDEAEELNDEEIKKYISEKS